MESGNLKDLGTWALEVVGRHGKTAKVTVDPLPVTAAEYACSFHRDLIAENRKSE